MKKNLLLATNLLVCATLLAACGSKAADKTAEEKSSNTMKVEKSSSAPEKKKEAATASVLEKFNKELVSKGKSTEEVYVTGDIEVGPDGDVMPGIYDLEVTGGDGGMTVENEETFRYTSYWLASPDTENPEYASKVRLLLFEGDKLTFRDISKVRFTAIGKDVKPSNELGIGQFIVGRDIEPGTYKLSTNVGLDSEYEEWRIEIANFAKEDSRTQTLGQKNPDVAVKLEEGEVISLDFDNDYEPEKPTNDVRLIFTSVE